MNVRRLAGTIGLALGAAVFALAQAGAAGRPFTDDYSDLIRYLHLGG